MTFATTRLEDATLARSALAPPFTRAGRPVVPGFFRGSFVVVGDVLGAVAIVVCLPFGILAIGMPIVLGVRLLLWLGGLL